MQKAISKNATTKNADHSDMLEGLKEAQNAEKDNRKMIEEADLFLNKRDGQWEPKIAQAWKDRPRYTFDHCNPIVDAIMAEMEQMDFAINVDPAGSGATKDIANIRGGIIRSIENFSNARYIYNAAARVMVGTGLAGWRLAQAYQDHDSFDQDLVIQEITNFKKRVWYDSNAVKRTMEDAKRCWVMTTITKEAYDKRWPKGSGLSVDRDEDGNAYVQKRKDEVTFGEYYSVEKKSTDLVLMSNGAVYIKDEKFLSVQDELLELGVVQVDERKKDLDVCYHQLFDGGDFLNDKNKTVFAYVPVIPAYANFNLLEDKVIYWGAVEKLMDAQRVYNYAESKKTADSSLKPIEKTWMTKEQAKSDDVVDTLATQNTNSDPIQFYDHVPDQPQPFKMPANQPDQVLMETAASSKQYLKEGSGIFAAMRGQAEPNQAAETVRLLQRKGDSSNYKYFIAMEIAIGHTCTIINDALPKIYDTAREMRVLGIDGTQDMISINDKVPDRQSGRVVELNNISKGNYAITCSAGPAFANQQQEIMHNILEMAKINPQLLTIGADILLKGMSGPDAQLLIERVRNQMISGGLIPTSQLTQEEQALVQQAQQQQQQPSPIEQAQLGIAQAEQDKAQAMTQDILSKIDERNQKMQFAMQEMMLKHQTAQEDKAYERDQKMIELIMKQADQLKTQAETLKLLKEASGADAIITPATQKTYKQQQILVDKSQAENL